MELEKVIETTFRFFWQISPHRTPYFYVLAFSTTALTMWLLFGTVDRWLWLSIPVFFLWAWCAWSAASPARAATADFLHEQVILGSTLVLCSAALSILIVSQIPAVGRSALWRPVVYGAALWQMVSGVIWLSGVHSTPDREGSFNHVQLSGVMGALLINSAVASGSLHDNKIPLAVWTDIGVLSLTLWGWTSVRSLMLFRISRGWIDGQRFGGRSSRLAMMMLIVVTLGPWRFFAPHRYDQPPPEKSYTEREQRQSAIRAHAERVGAARALVRLRDEAIGDLGEYERKVYKARLKNDSNEVITFVRVSVRFYGARKQMLDTKVERVVDSYEPLFPGDLRSFYVRLPEAYYGSITAGRGAVVEIEIKEDDEFDP